MNIKEAKEEIKHTLLAYHRRDEQGNYCYPTVRQRPVLLMGPPGIGKTAIMEQIAKECGVGLAAYTLTHHTRQSAIGLPRIVTKNYDGQEVTATEYTLSEIIASIYETMERTGFREGILFLDEINCVSETLVPTMLQLLQNKKFGTHKVPEGWLIVGAGNPQEYNRSVREFDIVTLDRVRRIEIEPDLPAWMEYAWEHGVHGAVLSYLNLRKDHFYVIENAPEDHYFVTARGWEDLSELLKNYEVLGISAGEDLIVQFLQQARVAEDFSVYYRLYRKYGMDYGIAKLLEGALEDEELERRIAMGRAAPYEERHALVGLLLEALNQSLTEWERTESFTVSLHGTLKHFRKIYADGGKLDDYIPDRRRILDVKREEGLIPSVEAEIEQKVIRQLSDYNVFLKENHISDDGQCWAAIKKLFSLQVEEREQLRYDLRQRFHRAFQFAEACFGSDREMLLLVSGLTGNRRAMDFVRENGCLEYIRHSELLLGTMEEEELQRECRRVLSEINDSKNDSEIE